MQRGFLSSVCVYTHGKETIEEFIWSMMKSALTSLVFCFFGYLIIICNLRYRIPDQLYFNGEVVVVLGGIFSCH
jgi:hypothetical protein